MTRLVALGIGLIGGWILVSAPRPRLLDRPPEVSGRHAFDPVEVAPLPEPAEELAMIRAEIAQIEGLRAILGTPPAADGVTVGPGDPAAWIPLVMPP